MVCAAFDFRARLVRGNHRVRPDAGRADCHRLGTVTDASRAWMSVMVRVVDASAHFAREGARRGDGRSVTFIACLVSE